MSIRRRSFTAILLSIVLSRCTCSSPTGMLDPNDAATPLDTADASISIDASQDASVDAGSLADELTDLARELVAATCERSVRCRSTADLAGCVAELEPLYRSFLLALLASIESGRTDFDREAASRCIEAFRALDCRSSAIELSDRGPCGAFFSGAVMDGSACYLEGECLDGAYCREPTACPGTCTRRGSDGARCSIAEQLYCAPDHFCIDDRCVPLEETLGADGDPCLPPGGCQAGLHCDVEDGSTCRGPRTAGDPCLAAEDCGSALRCDADTCAPRLSTGELCTDDRACAPDLYCALSNPRRCARGDLGDPCLNSRQCDRCWNGAYDCALRDPPLGCIGGSCAPLEPASLGGPCAIGEQCPLGTHCFDHDADLHTDPICTPLEDPPDPPPPAAEGEPCDGLTIACVSGLWCRPTDLGAGLCTVKLGIGESCDRSEACTSERCHRGQCAPPCEP